jgi:large subunit ribosomal protein L7Ae
MLWKRLSKSQGRLPVVMNWGMAALDAASCKFAQGKARLGTVVHQKTAAALALTAVKSEDQRELAKIVDSARTSFNDGPRISWGGGIMGPKSQAKARLREKEMQKELAQRLG